MAPLKKDDFGEEVARLLPVLLREVSRRQKELFSGNMTLSQMIVLDYLRSNGPGTMTDLSEELCMTLSAVTSIVDKMVEAGMVERKRSSEDRRVVMVSLCDKGTEMAGLIDTDRRNMAREVFSALEEDEQEEYLRLLKKVCANLSARSK